MRNHFTLAFAMICLLFVSCKTKDKNMTAQGTIIDSVSNTPLSNTNFVFVVTKSGGLSSKTSYIPYNFTTDASGSFNVSFQASYDDGLGITFPYSDPAQLTKYDYLWDTVIKDFGQTTFNTGVIYTKRP